jgi:hypothetical protein
MAARPVFPRLGSPGASATAGGAGSEDAADYLGEALATTGTGKTARWRRCCRNESDKLGPDFDNYAADTTRAVIVGATVATLSGDKSRATPLGKIAGILDRNFVGKSEAKNTPTLSY